MGRERGRQERPGTIPEVDTLQSATMDQRRKGRSRSKEQLERFPGRGMGWVGRVGLGMLMWRKMKFKALGE